MTINYKTQIPKYKFYYFVNGHGALASTPFGCRPRVRVLPMRAKKSLFLRYYIVITLCTDFVKLNINIIIIYIYIYIVQCYLLLDVCNSNNNIFYVIKNT